jgi:hypothetical protein
MSDYVPASILSLFLLVCCLIIYEEAVMNAAEHGGCALAPTGTVLALENCRIGLEKVIFANLGICLV